MKSKTSVVFIVLCALSLVVIYSATEIFGAELRAISAVITEMILRFGGLSIVRNNTILSLGGMTFDIIPACNGSTTLQVLFVSSLFLVLGNNKLNLPRKITCLILSIPVALLANGIRLALLVYASKIRGQVLAEGFLHYTIGVMGFLIALFIMLLLVDLLSHEADDDFRQTHLRRELFVTTLVFTGIALLPFFSACLRDWIGREYNQYDMFGFLFFFSGLICYWYFWKKFAEKADSVKLGVVLFSLSLLAGSAFQMISQNNYILGITFIIILFSLALMEKGKQFTLLVSPAILMTGLGFSKVSEIINQTLGTQGFVLPFVIKSIFALMLGGLLLVSYKRLKLAVLEKEKEQRPLRAKPVYYYSTAAIVALMSLFFSIRGYTVIEPFMEYEYQLEYLMGGWTGVQLHDGQAEEYYAKQQLISRTYHKGGEVVGLMVVPSNAMRQNIHTPEYCQEGLGWKIEKSEIYTFRIADNQEISARKLLMKNGFGIERTFLYWFQESSFSTGTYLKFVVRNSFQRLLGARKNWILYVVWQDNPKEQNGIDDFLANLRAVKFIEKKKDRKSPAG